MLSATTQALSIPAGPEGLTAHWLTEALRAGGVLDRGGIASFDCEELGVGKGFTGRLARVSIEYDGDCPDAPRSVIAKFPAERRRTRDLANQFRLYEREVRFYEELSHRVSVPAPRLYYSARGATDGEFVLLLEDAAPAREGDLLTGCSLDRAAKLVDVLARLHASWWDSRELKELVWLPPPNSDAAVGFIEGVGPGAWKLFRRKFGKNMPASIIGLGNKLARDRTVLDRLAEPPTTLVHADLRVNNLMFGEPPADDLQAVIDWQTATRGRGPMDVASLFVTSLQVEDRRAAETQLLPEYYHALHKFGVRDYSYEQCWLDYRLAVINQFSQVVFLSSVLDIESQLEDEVGPATGARLLTALIDLDLSELVPSNSMWRLWLRRFGVSGVRRA